MVISIFPHHRPSLMLLNLSEILWLFSEMTADCTHILWWQCPGDNEMSRKKGLGGVVGIILDGINAHLTLRKNTLSVFHRSPDFCLDVTHS